MRSTKDSRVVVPKLFWWKTGINKTWACTPNIQIIICKLHTYTLQHTDKILIDPRKTRLQIETLVRSSGRPIHFEYCGFVYQPELLIDGSYKSLPKQERSFLWTSCFFLLMTEFKLKTAKIFETYSLLYPQGHSVLVYTNKYSTCTLSLTQFKVYIIFHII